MYEGHVGHIDESPGSTFNHVNIPLALQLTGAAVLTKQTLNRSNLITNNTMLQLTDASLAASKLAKRLNSIMISSLEASAESTKSGLADLIRR